MFTFLDSLFCYIQFLLSLLITSRLVKQLSNIIKLLSNRFTLTFFQHEKCKNTVNFQTVILPLQAELISILCFIVNPFWVLKL